MCTLIQVLRLLRLLTKHKKTITEKGKPRSQLTYSIFCKIALGRVRVSSGFLKCRHTHVKRLTVAAGSISYNAEGPSSPRGPLIAKNFCGSILADCFVLTPHNNQLRHCQRNTHSSHVQSRVPPPSRIPAGLDWGTLMCESATADAFMLSFVALKVVVGKPHIKSPSGVAWS